MTNRSRRLRKKLHLDEFQELGFSVSWSFPAGTSTDDIDTLLDRFIEEAIEPHGLAYDGSGYLQWEGLICLQKQGKCTEQHRQLVQCWLESNHLQEIKLTDLFDVWWD